MWTFPVSGKVFPSAFGQKIKTHKQRDCRAEDLQFRLSLSCLRSAQSAQNKGGTSEDGRSELVNQFSTALDQNGRRRKRKRRRRSEWQGHQQVTQCTYRPRSTIQK